MQPRLSILTLGVRDLKRSIAFYRDGLGFEMSPQSNELIAYFPLRGLWLAVFPIELLSLDTRIPIEEFGKSPIVLAHNVPTRALVDETLVEAVAAGGRITKPAADTDWGGYAGFFADPDDHRWEVAWDPKLPV
jgi:catechol 2,3-dioxygenase-like lactoylglutathione lyase family enzyme